MNENKRIVTSEPTDNLPREGEIALKRIWPPEYKFSPPPSGKEFNLRNGMPSYDGEEWHEDDKNEHLD